MFIVDLLFEEIKQYMGIHMLAFFAQKELNVIVVKGNESVNAYYYWIFSLWENAKTLTDKQMKKLLQTMKPSISQPLLGHRYTTISELLNVVWDIEDAKKDISSNFLQLDKPKLS